MSDPFNTPILLIIFNRPDTTRIVFDVIRQRRPRQLFIAADAPREGRSEEKIKCDETRKIVSEVDWDCDVHTLFRDKNLGCGMGVSTAITWFFEHVEEGIILEDDCVPDPTFFQFCEELLAYYRDNPRIMHISGDNFLHGKKRGKSSYYFSQYTYMWGWATWKRAWHFFDFNILPFELRGNRWGLQWLLSVEKQDGLAVAPNVNLVTNIGSGRVDATHTIVANSKYDDLPAIPIPFPLTHPKKIVNMDHFNDVSPFVQYPNLGF
jgi:hypothetical protein